MSGPPEASPQYRLTVRTWSLRPVGSDELTLANRDRLCKILRIEFAQTWICVDSTETPRKTISSKTGCSNSTGVGNRSC